MAITLKKKNFAKSNLLGNVASNATTFSCTSSEGAKFTTIGSGYPFRAVIWRAAYSTPEADSTREVIQCYRSATDDFTITARGLEGTTAKAWSALDNFALVMTAGVLDEIEATIARKSPRVYSTTSLATLTPEIDTYDVFHLTAQAAALTIANHSSSTPTDGELMEIRILDNGTARAISFGTNYVAKAGTALPTTTIAGKNMVMLLEWWASLSKWNLLTAPVEA